MAFAAAGVLVVAVLTAFETPVHGSPFYTIGNLGTGCTPDLACLSHAFDVNIFGQTVGLSVHDGPPFNECGFRTGPQGSPMDLLCAEGPGHIEVYSINDQGVATGTQSVTPVFIPVFGLRWPPNGPSVMLPLPIILPFAVNNSDQIVGRHLVLPFFEHAFLLSGQTIQDLGTLPGGTFSEARAINDDGLIVGSSENGFLTRAVWFFGGQVIDLGVVGTCSLCSSAAYGISAAGGPLTPNGPLVVGKAEFNCCSGTSHAFLLELVNPFLGTITMQDLGTLCASGNCNSAAFDVNDLGQAVGESQVLSTSSTKHAFLYKVQDHQMTDLNALLSPLAQPDWELTDARAINDLGQIVGTGLFHGQKRAYLMTPPLFFLFPNAAELVAIALSGQPPGMERSLRAQLSAAEAAIQRGDLVAARGQLGAYENEVRALVQSRHLTEIHGTKLLAAAGLIRRVMVEERRE